MSEKKAFLLVVISAILVAGLNIYGYFFPGSTNWGFHLLGFFPSIILGLYILAMVFVLFSFRHPQLERLISRCASFADSKPRFFLFTVIAIFLMAAVAFSVKAPLLGDSFNFIKNFTDVFSGADKLGVWHEPLAMYLFYFIFKILNTTTAHEIIQTFFWLDLVMGVAYVMVLFGIARELFEDNVTRLLVFLWLLLLPTTQFFFGYVEIYAFTLLCLTAGVYLSILVLKEKISFIILPPFFLVLLFVHFLNGPLGLALLFVTVIQLKMKRMKEVAGGISIALAVLLIILFAVNFDIEQLMEQGPISHFLSLSENVSVYNSYSQAFSIFSVFHGVELANYVILMSPFAVVLIAYCIGADIRSFRSSSTLIFLGIITFSYVILICVAKIQQGMGNDWDVLAAYFVPLTLFAAVWFTRRTMVPNSAHRIFSFIVLVTAVHSLLWFSINSTVETKILRVRSFLDRRMISHIGHYTISLHLSRYFDYMGDSLRQADVWERYSAMIPGDPRGYENTISYLHKLTTPDYSREARVYDSWIRIDSLNAGLRKEYFDMSSKAGVFYFGDDSVKQALQFFEKAVTLYPSSPYALNNFGSALARDGNATRAIDYFLAALEADSTYSQAYFNLGMAYEEVGEKLKSIQALRQAARLNNREAQDYLNNIK